MNVRFKKTGKSEVAILPRKEYEAMARAARANEAYEDAGTARLAARAREEIAAGAPLFPMATVRRITDGENAVRVFRERKKITQTQLAAKTKLGQGYISDLESGRRNGTIEAMKRIADALGVPLDLLV